MRSVAGLLFIINFLCSPVMAIDRPTKILELNISSVLPSGTIIVKIVNTSNAPIRIWDESNSWGAARWRVLRVRHGQLETLFQNPDQRFTVNGPTFHELAPGAQTERKLDVNAGKWCGPKYCASFEERGIGGRNIHFEPHDEIFVIYDVPRTTEASSMDVMVWSKCRRRLGEIPLKTLLAVSIEPRRVKDGDSPCACARPSPYRPPHRRACSCPSDCYGIERLHDRRGASPSPFSNNVSCRCMGLVRSPRISPAFTYALPGRYSCLTAVTA